MQTATSYIQELADSTKQLEKHVSTLILKVTKLIIKFKHFKTEIMKNQNESESSEMQSYRALQRRMKNLELSMMENYNAIQECNNKINNIAGEVELF